MRVRKEIGKNIRVFAGEVRVKIPFIGSKIEKEILEKLKAGQENYAKLLNEWLKNQKPQ